MKTTNKFIIGCTSLSGAFLLYAGMPAQAQSAAETMALTEARCTSSDFARTISPDLIGEPVSAVVLDSVSWQAASGNSPAHCLVNGHMDPIDTSATARPIRFGVALPAEWNRRSIQKGGGGMNGSVPGLGGGDLSNGFATYGSDSGHSNGDDEWGLNDEAIMNLGYMQMKKTHDAAMELMRRAYGEEPTYNYYVGGSQGGREALTVAQRYPDDYEGIMSTVPIVGFSSLMLSRAHMRIQETKLENYVPPVKGNAILAEFLRQCDGLDGRQDGVMNNYFDCRAIFNVNDGIGPEDPWAAKRCPNNVDPDPEDASVDACLTSGQIETVEFFFSNFEPEVELVNGRTNFGMWAPTTSVGGSGLGAPAGGGARAGGAPGSARAGGAPGGARAGGPAAGGRGGFPGGARAGGPAAGGRGGFPGGGRGGMAMGGGGGGGGLFVGQRYRGQEGAADDAPLFTNLGSIGVVGFAMQDLDANPLDYSDSKYRDRREQLSGWLDSTDPDLGAFRARGSKMLVMVGTDDTTASSGEQLNYYQTVLDAMGRDAVDSFARLWVIPQGGHGLSGRSAPINGEGEPTESIQVPSSADRFALLQNWVENGVAPGMSETVTSGDRSGPMCSYPTYPHYESGDPAQASSYRCAQPTYSD